MSFASHACTPLEGKRNLAFSARDLRRRGKPWRRARGVYDDKRAVAGAADVKGVIDDRHPFAQFRTSQKPVDSRRPRRGDADPGSDAAAAKAADAKCRLLRLREWCSRVHHAPHAAREHCVTPLVPVSPSRRNSLFRHEGQKRYDRHRSQGPGRFRPPRS